MITLEQRLRIMSTLSAGSLSRTELTRYREQVLSRIDPIDSAIEEIERAFDNAIPSDSYVVFMGFCPGASFSRRQDLRWRELGICEFEFDSSETQIERFSSIRVGDTIILKKRETIGKTMKLFGHGRVLNVEYSPEGRRLLKMDWHPSKEIIEVPLMGCNSTVNLRKISVVSQRMPLEFHRWIDGCLRGV